MKARRESGRRVMAAWQRHQHQHQWRLEMKAKNNGMKMSANEASENEMKEK
jgi:hypothetical protein